MSFLLFWNFCFLGSAGGDRNSKFNLKKWSFLNQIFLNFNRYFLRFDESSMTNFVWFQEGNWILFVLFRNHDNDGLENPFKIQLKNSSGSWNWQIQNWMKFECSHSKWKKKIKFISKSFEWRYESLNVIHSEERISGLFKIFISFKIDLTKFFTLSKLERK